MNLFASTHNAEGVCAYIALDISRAELVDILRKAEVVPDGMTLENVTFRGDGITIELVAK